MMPRATEFTVRLEDKPGTLAAMTEALGSAGINIEAIHGTALEAQGVIQFITNGVESTRNLLEAEDYTFTTREVLLLRVANQPSSLARVAQGLANAGINIDGVYISINQLVVLGVSNLSEAEELVRGMDLM